MCTKDIFSGRSGQILFFVKTFLLVLFHNLHSASLGFVTSYCKSFSEAFITTCFDDTDVLFCHSRILTSLRALCPCSLTKHCSLTKKAWILAIQRAPACQSFILQFVYRSYHFDWTPKKFILTKPEINCCESWHKQCVFFDTWFTGKDKFCFFLQQKVELVAKPKMKAKTNACAISLCWSGTLF